MPDPHARLREAILATDPASLQPLKEVGLSLGDLADRLAAEIHAGRRGVEGGSPFAPDQFTLSLNPDDAKSFSGRWEGVQRALTMCLTSALRAEGLMLSRDPHVTLATDPTLPRGSLQVIAWHSGDPLQMREPAPVEGIQAGEEPQGAFLVVSGQRIFSLESHEVRVGRRLDNDLVLDNPHVSRYHAVLHVSHGHFHVRDLNSTAGVIVNGKRAEQAELTPGDVITLGGVELIYGESPGAPPASAEAYLRPAPPVEDHPTIVPSERGTISLDEQPTSPKEPRAGSPE